MHLNLNFGHHTDGWLELVIEFFGILCWCYFFVRTTVAFVFFIAYGVSGK